VADQQTIANNVASWFPSATISLTAFTLNSVDVVASLSSSDSITLLSYLSLNMLIGVIVGCNSTASGTVSSLSFDSVRRVISFAIPADVLDDATSTNPQWTAQYELCVGVMGLTSAPVVSKTKTTISVKSLLTSLLGVQNKLTIRQEDYVSSAQRLFRLPLATDDSFKTDRLSPSVLSGALFTVAATTRAIGASCSGLQQSNLDSFVIGREVAIVMTAATVSLLWKAQQGVICASINGAVGVVVSAVVFDSFSVTSSLSTLSVNRGGNVITIHGVYAAALVSSAINSSSSFISTTATCTTPMTDFTVSLRPSLLNSTSSSSSSNAAINASQAILVVSAPFFDTTATYYICVVWNEVRVPVTFLGTGAAVRLVAPTPDASSSDLVIVSDASGWIDLTTYILPAQTASDTTAVRAALSFLNVGGNVFFLAADPSTSVAQKSALCAASSRTAFLQVSTGGLIYLTSSQLPSASILCSSDGSFLRVTSRVITIPFSDFASFNGVRFIVPDAAALLSSAILLPPGVQSTQLSLCLAPSAMSCTSNVTIPISSTIDGTFYALVTPTVSLTPSAMGLFIGTAMGSSTKVGAFVPTGVSVRLDRFSGALALWKSNVGISLPWSLTSSEALCGSGAFPFALPIENGVMLSSALQWPRAYEIVLSQMGSSSAITVAVSGSQVPIVVVKGLILAFGPQLSTDSMCVDIAPLRLLSGRVQTGIASVATLSDPILTLLRSNLYTGLLLSLIPSTDTTCAAAGATGHTLMFTSYDHLDTSGIDLAPLLWDSKFSYFRVCFSVHGQWVGPVANTFILTTFAPGEAASSWVNYIESDDSPTERTIWQSQQVAWSVYGIFPSLTSTNAYVVLVWDDQTCVSAPQNSAIVAPVSIRDAKSGTVMFDVSSLKGSGTKLFPCYVGDNSTLAWPMTLESVYSRYFVVRSLIVSQLQYQTTVAVGALASDLYLPLTDANQAPITQFSAFVGSSATDYNSAGDCSPLNAKHISFFSVSVDIFGQRWLVVPATFINQNIGSSADAHVYFVMCATAAPESALSPLYQQVQISLDVSSSATSIAHNYNVLVIEFSSSNNNTEVGGSTLAAYAAALVTRAAPSSGYTVANASNVLTTILAASIGTVQVALYIPPTVITGISVSSADDLTNRVFSALTSGDCVALASTNGSLSIKTTSLRQVFNTTQFVQPAMACGSAAGEVKSGTTTYIIFMLVILVIVGALAAMSLRHEVPIRSSPNGEQQETTMKPRTALGDSVLVSPSPRKPVFEVEGAHGGESSMPQPDLTASPVKAKPDLLSPVRPSRVDTPASPHPIVTHEAPLVRLPSVQSLPSSVTVRAPVVIDFPVVASKSTVVGVDERDPLHDDDDSDDGYNHADF
jgi:hypothetical protein